MSLSPSDLVPLVNVQQKVIALNFSHYLQSIGIKSDIETARDDNGTIDGWAVLCLEEELTRSRVEFEQFINNPHHPKYQQVAWDQSRSVKLNTNGQFYQQVKTNFLSQAGPFTLAIFAICWAVFAATFLYFFDASFNLLKFNIDGDLNQTFAQPWRFLTPAVFHFSILHIAFNTMWWWQIGGQIEKTLGLKHIIAIFLSSALLSNIAQFFVSGPNFGGLSGVVYAVLGFAWIYGHLQPNRGIYLSNPIIGFMLFWLVLGFTDFMPINVANTAHLIGLLAGMGYAAVLAKAQTK
ncbi:rhomboid family intramembrane serine protease GlpG [Thalassomonas sp. M1454]|uniref:rhomboid family intramembrane serine protease GlpG n=1 Tax=Thalassomonas sp. M1454 TaxID=2594477 RepID=UPI00117E34F0|nr:rhomboid family intramembrane serine protease GlpG [Thalassomonas sp. M1454]TRX55195.1 rhomboid family intramembrane serine protease GlpG [Thalassomonas sp. M1454]